VDILTVLTFVSPLIVLLCGLLHSIQHYRCRCCLKSRFQSSIVPKRSSVTTQRSSMNKRSSFTIKRQSVTTQRSSTSFRDSLQLAMPLFYGQRRQCQCPCFGVERDFDFFPAAFSLFIAFLLSVLSLIAIRPFIEQSTLSPGFPTDGATDSDIDHEVLWSELRRHWTSAHWTTRSQFAAHSVLDWVLLHSVLPLAAWESLFNFYRCFTTMYSAKHFCSVSTSTIFSRFAIYALSFGAVFLLNVHCFFWLFPLTLAMHSVLNLFCARSFAQILVAQYQHLISPNSFSNAVHFEMMRSVFVIERLSMFSSSASTLSLALFLVAHDAAVLEYVPTLWAVTAVAMTLNFVRNRQFVHRHLLRLRPHSLCRHGVRRSASISSRPNAAGEGKASGPGGSSNPSAAIPPSSGRVTAESTESAVRPRREFESAPRPRIHCTLRAPPSSATSAVLRVSALSAANEALPALRELSCRERDDTDSVSTITVESMASEFELTVAVESVADCECIATPSAASSRSPEAGEAMADRMDSAEQRIAAALEDLEDTQTPNSEEIEFWSTVSSELSDCDDVDVDGAECPPFARKHTASASDRRRKAIEVLGIGGGSEPSHSTSSFFGHSFSRRLKLHESGPPSLSAAILQRNKERLVHKLSVSMKRSDPKRPQSAQWATARSSAIAADRERRTHSVGGDVDGNESSVASAASPSEDTVFVDCCYHRENVLGDRTFGDRAFADSAFGADRGRMASSMPPQEFDGAPDAVRLDLRKTRSLEEPQLAVSDGPPRCGSSMRSETVTFCIDHAPFSQSQRSRRSLSESVKEGGPGHHRRATSMPSMPSADALDVRSERVAAEGDIVSLLSLLVHHGFYSKQRLNSMQQLTLLD